MGAIEFPDDKGGTATLELTGEELKCTPTTNRDKVLEGFANQPPEQSFTTLEAPGKTLEKQLPGWIGLVGVCFYMKYKSDGKFVDDADGVPKWSPSVFFVAGDSLMACRLKG